MGLYLLTARACPGTGHDSGFLQDPTCSGAYKAKWVGVQKHSPYLTPLRRRPRAFTKCESPVQLQSAAAAAS